MSNILGVNLECTTVREYLIRITETVATQYGNHSHNHICEFCPLSPAHPTAFISIPRFKITEKIGTKILDRDPTLARE